MKWPLVFIKKSLANGALGTTHGPFVFITEKYKDNKAVLEHELTHVRQWAKLFMPFILIYIFMLTRYNDLEYAPYYPLILIFGFCLDSILYIYVRKYRLKAEIEAYRVQANYETGYPMTTFAKYLSTNYDLKIAEQEAYRLLTTRT